MSLPPGVDPSQIPLAKNPSGAPPNFDDPPGLVPHFIASVAILSTLTTGAAVIRAYVNFRAKRKIGWDDGFCFFAWATITAYGGLCLSAHYLLRHDWDISVATMLNPQTIERTSTIGMLSAPLYFFCKGSVLLLYARIFEPVRWLRWTVRGMMIFLFFWAWSILPVQLVYCAPDPGKSWDASIGQSCKKTSIVALPQGGISMVYDIIMFILPLPIIAKLHLPPQRKFGLAMVFATGAIGVITGILGLYFRVLVATKAEMWTVARLWLVNYVENSVTVLVSCTPSVASLWTKHIKESGFWSSLRTSFVRPYWKITSKQGSSSRSEPYPSEASIRPKHEGDSMELSKSTVKTTIQPA